jgi:hypothetical protein
VQSFSFTFLGNLQLTNAFTDWQDLVCNCGVSFSGGICVVIRVRILKLFRDSSKTPKAIGLFPLWYSIAPLGCRTGKFYDQECSFQHLAQKTNKSSRDWRDSPSCWLEPIDFRTHSVNFVKPITYTNKYHHPQKLLAAKPYPLTIHSLLWKKRYYAKMRKNYPSLAHNEVWIFPGTSNRYYWCEW